MTDFIDFEHFDDIPCFTPMPTPEHIDDYASALEHIATYN